MGTSTTCEDIRRAVLRAALPSLSTCCSENGKGREEEGPDAHHVVSNDSYQQVAGAVGETVTPCHVRVLFTGCAEAGTVAAMYMLILRDVLMEDLRTALPCQITGEVSCVTFGSEPFLDSRDLEKVPTETLQRMAHVYADISPKPSPVRIRGRYRHHEPPFPRPYSGGGLPSWCSLRPGCRGCDTNDAECHHYVLPGRVVSSRIEPEGYLLREKRSRVWR